VQEDAPLAKKPRRAVTPARKNRASKGSKKGGEKRKHGNAKNLRFNFDPLTFPRVTVNGMARVKGLRLFADEVIRKDQLIGEYKERGDYDFRLREYLPMTMRGRIGMNESGQADWLICATKATFVTHSCRPNAYFKVCSDGDGGEEKVAIVAGKAIRHGAEITMDYKWALAEGAQPTPCHCRKPGCRGQIEIEHTDSVSTEDEDEEETSEEEDVHDSPAAKKRK
jgi:hypothetical protein